MHLKKNNSDNTKKDLSKKITKDMTITEVMELNPEYVGKLLNMGLGCGGCHFAMIETLEQGCRAHGLDADEVIKELTEIE